MTLIAWSIAFAVTLLGWVIAYDECAAPQPWTRRVYIVIGWACMTWAVGEAFPFPIN